MQRDAEPEGNLRPWQAFHSYLIFSLYVIFAGHLDRLVLCGLDNL